jgi:hypothetical protein
MHHWRKSDSQRQGKDASWVQWMVKAVRKKAVAIWDESKIVAV